MLEAKIPDVVPEPLDPDVPHLRAVAGVDLQAGDRDAALASAVRGHFLDERHAAPALGDDDRAIDDRAGAGAPVLLHLERELDRHARGDVDERAPVREGGAVERAERGVALQRPIR